MVPRHPWSRATLIRRHLWSRATLIRRHLWSRATLIRRHLWSRATLIQRHLHGHDATLIQRHLHGHDATLIRRHLHGHDEARTLVARSSDGSVGPPIRHGPGDATCMVIRWGPIAIWSRPGPHRLLDSTQSAAERCR